MHFLHKSVFLSHGHLTSAACVVSNKFVVKVRDYGISEFRKHEDLLAPKSSDVERDYSHLLWRAPELLRGTMPVNGTQVGTSDR